MLRFNPENTGVISDFDRTISRADTSTVFGIFRDCPSIPPELNEAQSTNFQRYRPKELDPTLTPQEREKYMKEWHNAAMEAFHKYLTEDNFQAALSYAKKSIDLRDNISSLTTNLQEYNIPFVVSSAGIADIIKAVLEYRDIPHDGVQGNHLEFDGHGDFVGVSNPVYIGQKRWEFLGQDLQNKFRDRTDIILLGDDPDDVVMGPQDRRLHKIGFLLSEQKSKTGGEELMRQRYDHIIESDTGDNDFLSQITFT